jgi:hypothetical protein
VRILEQLVLTKETRKDLSEDPIKGHCLNHEDAMDDVRVTLACEAIGLGVCMSQSCDHLYILEYVSSSTLKHIYASSIFLAREGSTFVFNAVRDLRRPRSHAVVFEYMAKSLLEQTLVNAFCVVLFVQRGCVRYQFGNSLYVFHDYVHCHGLHDAIAVHACKKVLSH